MKWRVEFEMPDGPRTWLNTEERVGRALQELYSAVKQFHDGDMASWSENVVEEQP